MQETDIVYVFGEREMSFNEELCEFGKLPKIDWLEWSRIQLQNAFTELPLTCNCGEMFDCQYNLKKHKEIVHIS